MQPNAPKQNDPHTPDPSDVPFASNEVRLSPRQCVVGGIILAGLFYFIPVLWPRIEPLELDRDFRLPFSLGYDYWTYRRCCGEICSQEKTLVIGDSVVWGHFVTRQQTLSHYLNREAAEERFVNLGVDGIHPAAMAGLVQYYGRDIAGRDVVLHCNLLWTCSEDRDLQTSKERTFNHPRLVPQFFPDIPCYKEPLSGRLGIVAERHVPLFSWAGHLRIAYFGDSDLPHWTIENPYENPAAAVTLELPSPDEPPSDRPPRAAGGWRPWTDKGIPQQNFPWVELDGSLQWRLFQRTVELLRDRGNRVFVLVGPLNEHMLKPESLRTYAKRKKEVAAWLKQQGIGYCVAAVLPSQYYADASHPLAKGYERLARQLFESDSFIRFRSPRPAANAQ